MSVRSIDRFAERLLRRHVRERAQRRAQAGFQRSVAACARAAPPAVQVASPKSRTFALPFGVMMMLSGLMSRCTMPAACASASASAICDGEVDRASRIQRPAGDDRRQRLAGDELEDQEQLALVLADLVQRGDVRVRQRRRRARFAQEPLAPSRHRRQQPAGSTLMATVRPRRVSRAR